MTLYKYTKGKGRLGAGNVTFTSGLGGWSVRYAAGITVHYYLAGWLMESSGLAVGFETLGGPGRSSCRRQFVDTLTSPCLLFYFKVERGTPGTTLRKYKQ